MIESQDDKRTKAVTDAVVNAPRNPGQELPNGATIIADRYVGEDGDYGERHIVLAIVQGQFNPYVVWTRYIGVAETATRGYQPHDYTLYGDYHRELEPAVAAYRERS